MARPALARRVIGRPTGDNVKGTTNIVLAIGMDALRDGYKGILEYIYAPRHYYARVRTMLREFKTPRIRGALDWQRIKAFLRASIRLGILGEQRFHYWRLLAWTCFRRPELLPEAVKVHDLPISLPQGLRTPRPLKDDLL